MALSETWSFEADLDGDISGTYETDWTAYLQRVEVHRGRQHSLATMEPSWATFYLDNSDGRFSPDNAIYTLDHFKRVRLKTSDDTLFVGFISNLSFEPETAGQRAILEAVDILGLAGNILISMGFVDGQTSDLVLQRILDLIERGDIIANHGCEVDTDGWSAVGSAISRETTTVFEGDGSLKCHTDNAATGEGVSYDVTTDAAVATAWQCGFFLYAPNGATLRFCPYDDVAGNYVLYDTDITGTGAWQYVRCNGTLFLNNASTSRAFRVLTMTSTQHIDFYVDGFHAIPWATRIDRTMEAGQTTLYRVSFAETPALEAIQQVVDSEPGFFWVDWYGVCQFKDKDYGAGAPTITYGDDGTNKRYQGLRLHYDGDDRISKVRVRCKSPEYTETVTVVVWRYGRSITVGAGSSFLVYGSQAAPSRNNTIICLPAQASCTATWYYDWIHYRNWVIKLTNGDVNPWTITDLHVEGKPISIYHAEEESIYEYEPTGTLPWIRQVLEIDMPFTANTDTIVSATATALGDKYVDRVLRADITILPKTHANFLECIGLDIRSRIRLINDTTAYSLGIDKNCWVEGIDYMLQDGGTLAEFTLHIEEVYVAP